MVAISNKYVSGFARGRFIGVQDGYLCAEISGCATITFEHDSPLAAHLSRNLAKDSVPTWIETANEVEQHCYYPESPPATFRL